MYKIGAIILAAGQSKRMGKPKLFLPYQGIPIIHYPVKMAVQNHLTPIVVVGGKNYDQLKKELEIYHQKISIIYNERYEIGMSTSLIVGVNSLNGELDAVLIFLGDQPLVADEVIKNLINTYQKNKKNGVYIVRPRYKQSPGHPILFDKSLLKQFQHIKGDEGGKSIIKTNEEHLRYVDFKQSDWNLDIDTKEDYDQLINNILNKGV
ncbi:nucleotidyltransferase family protein [Rummeliibacillus suwonensis]|uniref:nucleotidyltransferase family protein n=1 Tax=Rummeliibacillus suwonensis TaxID=1306154 RepID=UPI0016476599|nr:nucleotidyltransferase family protein [Rummeliibacillus suwonensis]